MAQQFYSLSFTPSVLKICLQERILREVALSLMEQRNVVSICLLREGMVPENFGYRPTFHFLYPSKWNRIGYINPQTITKTKIYF